jgi:hypothetical protein
MSGFDILISQPVDREPLKLAIAQATKLDLQSILLLDRSPFEDHAPSIRLLCVARLNEGLFPFHMALDSVQGGADLDMHEVVPALAQILKLSILMDDGSPLPFRMMLVEPGEAPVVVEIFETDDGIYEVSREFWVPPEA